MENTALNGTTNATKYHEDWKKKKGYRPILVAVSLALLLSLYAAGYLGSGTHLRHGEMGTTNAAASSSSTALVGSGTAASDLKTLTMETDACVWTEQLTQCMGLTKYPALTTAEACKNACCDDKNCGVWQFSAADYVNQCWYGAFCNNKGRLIWEYGGIRTGGGLPGAKCENTSDCAIPPGLDHGVCLEGYCQPGTPTPRSFCEVTNDCVKPPGLNHPVCRDGRCQSGASGSKCGATSDCVRPPGLDHGVCRRGKCQRGVFRDYCGQDSDCIAGLYCDGMCIPY